MWSSYSCCSALIRLVFEVFCFSVADILWILLGVLLGIVTTAAILAVVIIVAKRSLIDAPLVFPSVFQVTDQRKSGNCYFACFTISLNPFPAVACHQEIGLMVRHSFSRGHQHGLCNALVGDFLEPQQQLPGEQGQRYLGAGERLPGRGQPGGGVA